MIAGIFLRPFWAKWFRFNWKFGLLLLVLICVPRFILVLNANVSGSYGSIGVLMLLSAIVPFVFLNADGRRKIGLTKPSNPAWLVLAFAGGLAFSLVLYYVGLQLYGNSSSNWYVYIARSYNIAPGMAAADKNLMFWIVALTGMTFSPIGEEFFFRGIVHSSFAASIGDRRASVVDAAAFALVHLSHFGLVFINQQWSFLPGPALLWILSMFLVSLLFFTSRQKSGSILGAVLCHAGFNLGMIYSIFYLL